MKTETLSHIFSLITKIYEPYRRLALNHCHMVNYLAKQNLTLPKFYAGNLLFICSFIYTTRQKFLYTKTKRPYSLQSLCKGLKDQCEEINVIGEEKFY